MESNHLEFLKKLDAWYEMIVHPEWESELIDARVISYQLVLARFVEHLRFAAAQHFVRSNNASNQRRDNLGRFAK